MISREWQRARRRTLLRRTAGGLAAVSVLVMGLLAVPGFTSTGQAPAGTTRVSADRKEACRLIVGPAKAYCERRPPRVMSPPGERTRDARVLLAPASALLALAGLRRWGKPGRP
ncbi:hypothetical protein GCM10010277_69390 [Streptomyces longisporoflavus]|uniref:hypothetical protein n=1 Tax=Streptomyces longisporoflavus TaxID=28044 RepID=UPI00167D3EFF|nr:hypothetical protein [Streptomyces longisporoflavus]GGV63323.1 hypothetical protein GCM10010277_69390 [Streptomyces longisporoflavus]